MTLTKMVPTGVDIFQIVAMGDIKVQSILGLICTVIHFQILQLLMKYRKFILILMLKKFHGLVIQLNSNYASNILVADNKFNAIQFHFHAESEHTINGKRFDFEMHAVHLANTTKNGIIASAMGVIFDFDDFDKSVTPEQVVIIDRFFDSLMLNL